MKCTRCGRKTHYASSCYATKHIDGSIICEEEEESDDEVEVCDRYGGDYVCNATINMDGEFIDSEDEEESSDEEEDNRGVYSLELNNGKYYVGKSEDMEPRIGKHENGHGSAWTKLHGVIGEIPTITPHMEDLESWERCETIAMGLKYGIENVRGHLWTRVTLPRSDIISFETQVCERMDFCRKCGRGCHMIGSCRSSTKAKWMTPDVCNKRESTGDGGTKKKSKWNRWK